MPERWKGCNASSAEMFSGLQARAVGEFERGDFLSSFDFDAGNTQKGFLTAGNAEIVAVVEDGAGGWAGCGGGYGGLWHLRSGFVRGADRIFCATEEVAGGASERCVGSGPGSESAHAVENGLGGEGPVDAAVFFFEERSQG